MIVTILVGVVTFYTATTYGGQPLYCGGTYAESTEPWVALQRREVGYSWECGDLIAIYFEDADEVLLARAMDAGPFGGYCVVYSDGCLPIVADVPEHLWPTVLDGDTSARVRVVNVTAECRARGYCD